MTNIQLATLIFFTPFIGLFFVICFSVIRKHRKSFYVAPPPVHNVHVDEPPRPTSAVIMEKRREGKLHCEDGPAQEWDNGEQLYYLNGVLMKKEYVMQPAEKLSPKAILRETNVDVRRELLRKIGIDRFLSVAPHRVLDTEGEEYALLGIDLDNNYRDRRYLKMRNPSIGVWHLEGVSQRCRTVQQARNWRRYRNIQKEWKPEVLT